MVKYLYYQTEKKNAAGISDRRASLAVLFADAKLTNRIAIVPKFKLSQNHNNGRKISESYLINTYFDIQKLGVEYIYDDVFKKEIINNIKKDDILFINSEAINVLNNKTLVIRKLKNDNFWSLKYLKDVINLAGKYHGIGMKLTIPMFTVPKYISDLGNRILSILPRPIVGIHLRRGNRLNNKLNISMKPYIIKKKIKKLKYSSVYYCSNDTTYNIIGENFYCKLNFVDILGNITNNYILFCIEMFIVDRCDVSIRTFSDSSIYYYKDNIDINYSLTNYSMHNSSKENKDIPSDLVLQNYDN